MKMFVKLFSRTSKLRSRKGDNRHTTRRHGKITSRSKKRKAPVSKYMKGGDEDEEQNKKIFEKMNKWLKSLNLDIDKETYNHTLYNLYFTWSGLRTACSIFTLGQNSSEFAKIFGLGFKKGPYFDIPGNDWIYFINKNFIEEFEPLFQKLEDTYILPNPDAEEFAPDILTERINLIGTILGFDKKCVKQGNEIQDNDNITIFFYVFPIENYEEHSEVFSYGCNMNTPNWINYPIELMKRSKKYLKPLGLKLGFHVMDWSP